MLYRGQGSAARDSGFAASSSARRKTAPSLSLPCAKGGGSGGPGGIVFFILPFSSPLVRLSRRSSFCYFRPAESNGEAAGSFAQAPGPPPRCRFAVMLI